MTAPQREGVVDRIAAPGSGLGDLLVETLGGSRCGSVKNGLAVIFEGQRAGFVLSFEDLERVYLAAKAWRENDRGGAS